MLLDGSLGSTRSIVWEPSRHGSLRYEEKAHERLNALTFKDRLKLMNKIFKDECNLLKEEAYSAIDRADNPKHFENGDIYYVYKFRDNQDLIQDFEVAADSDHQEGFSQGSFSVSPLGYGLFQGYINTTPPDDGRVQYAGWVSMLSPRARKSFYRRHWHDWSHFTHMVFRVRGDGRTYHFRVHCEGDMDICWFDGWDYAIFTHGGPYWQFVRIPFSRLFFSYKGRIQDIQDAILLTRVTRFSIIVKDKVTGPFRLEIDYVGLMRDRYNRRKFEYERYNVPEHAFREP